MTSLLNAVTKPFKETENGNSSNEENPEYFVEKLNSYQPTAEYTIILNKLLSTCGTCDESFIKKFIDLFGVIKLMHVLDVVQRSGPTKMDPNLKSEHLIRILSILDKIVNTKCGHEYFQKSYEMEPEESNLLRTFVSYLTLENERENEILLDLINSLNESHNFAQHCYHQLKQPRPDTNNGFQLICQLLDPEDSSKAKLINSICLLIKKVVTTIPNDSESYKGLIVDLHDFGINDKLEIIGNSHKNDQNENLPLELYNDLATRYGQIDI